MLLTPQAMPGDMPGDEGHNDSNICCVHICLFSHYFLLPIIMRRVTVWIIFALVYFQCVCDVYMRGWVVTLPWGLCGGQSLPLVILLLLSTLLLRQLLTDPGAHCFS